MAVIVMAFKKGMHKDDDTTNCRPILFFLSIFGFFLLGQINNQPILSPFLFRFAVLVRSKIQMNFCFVVIPRQYKQITSIKKWWKNFQTKFNFLSSLLMFTNLTIKFIIITTCSAVVVIIHP